MKTYLLVFYTCMIWLFTRVSATDPGHSRQPRNVYCHQNEYPSGDLCCLHCPAGTHLKSPCTKSGEKSQCEECNYGTYTEHANDLRQCLKCTKCRYDQELARPCTLTQDAECKCGSGGFCHPDEACEVCMKCSKCENGKVAVRNCTSTTNTECKQTQPGPVSVPYNVVFAVAGMLVILGFCVFFLVLTFKMRKKIPKSQVSKTAKSEKIYIHSGDESSEEQTRRLSSTNLSLSRQMVRAKSLPGVEEECKMLCESLNSSASNSQHSLTCLPSSSAALTPAPRAHPSAFWRRDKREEDRFLKIIAVNGEQSLRACFVYFEELNMDCHKRFFRLLGISDNVIKGREPLPYEDRVHELLDVWVERRGRDASLDDLLTVLLELNQKHTAETIQDRAIRDGHYICESQEKVVF